LSSKYQDPQKNPAKVLDNNEEGMVRSFLQQGSARTRPKETKPVTKKDDNDVGESSRGEYE
jgi:hypothetical protein